MAGYIGSKAVSVNTTSATITGDASIGGDLSLGDNDKIILGAGSDLQIYSDGTTSRIYESGSGLLTIRASNFNVNTADGSESYITMVDGGAVTSYHNGAAKIATKATGVTVTGEMAATTMDLSSNAVIDGTALVTGVLTTTAATVFNGGFAANAASTISTADNLAQLKLISTDADANSGPRIHLERNSGSPADGDIGGVIEFSADNDAGEMSDFARIRLHLDDVSNGSEDGNLKFFTLVAGTERSRIKMDSTEIAFNDDSVDVDFRVESNGNTEMLLINGGTNKVGIGANPAYTLDVNASVAADSLVRMNNSSDSNPYVLALSTSAASTDNNVRTFIHAQDSTTARFIVWSDGDVQNHDNSYGAISDQRIKQNISDATSQWDDIKALRVRKFKLKDDVRAYGDDASFKLGLVAQEAEIVSPNLINETPANRGDVLSSSEFGTLYEEGDTIPDGQAVGSVKERTALVKGVKYSILYMKAIKALQEAMTRIETLEAKVAVLEG
jgi:hypothetical protein